MLEAGARGAVIFASGMEEKTISRQFAPEEEGTLLEYVLDSAWTVADELFVVFDHEPKLSLIEGISPFGVKVLTTRGQSPIQTICNAFKSAKSEHCLLVTERTPFLKPNVALALFEDARGHDLAIPRWKDGRMEPLLATYR
ncbi:MAG: nucleotidyltransferase family protein, partial [Nitrososphaerales archaeon]